MEILYPSDKTAVAVSVMRRGEALGLAPEELADGNMLPSLCMAVGAGACKVVCQKQTIIDTRESKICAQENAYSFLTELGIDHDTVLLAQATEDAVAYAHEISEDSIVSDVTGLPLVRGSNALFYRPGLDRLPNGKLIRAIGMRMADCGAVTVELLDDSENSVQGIVHFTKANMCGPGHFKQEHQLAGEKVTWAEFVIGSALSMYHADPTSVRLNLVAAIGDDEYVQKYSGMDDARSHFPGWDELGFVHPQEATGKLFLNYVDMIRWQIEQARQHFGLLADTIELNNPINTGDISLGHASYRQHRNSGIANGRDLYLVMNRR